eukprot:symbB.v1.2.037686.t1/scaffold5634.1/size25136/2
MLCCCGVEEPKKLEVATGQNVDEQKMTYVPMTPDMAQGSEEALIDQKLPASLRALGEDSLFEVRLDKRSSGSYGFSLEYDFKDALHADAKDPCLLLSLHGGAVQQWNVANPTQNLKVRDRIVEANGTRGASQAIFEIIKDSEQAVEIGKYLATKWRFEKTQLFHCLAVALVFMVLACFLITAFVTGSTLKSAAFGQLFEAWFLYGSLAWIVTLCSAYALLPSWSPRFHYDGEAFQRLRFKRSWKDVFWISSQDFARDLEEAILLAGCGKWKRLREILEDPEQGEEVLQICQLLDEEVWSLASTSTDGSVASDCELPSTQRFRCWFPGFSLGDVNPFQFFVGMMSEATLTVQRPKELKVPVKSCRSLGLDLAYGDSMVGLLIKQVNEGPVMQWNTSATDQVSPGDRIVTIKGGTDTGTPEDAETLLKQLQATEGEATLTILSWK